MVSDLVGIFLSLAVWLLLFTGQGMSIGYLTNIFNFARRCLLRKLGLSFLLCLAILPVIYNLLGVFFGVQAIVVAIAALFLLLTALAIFKRRQALRAVQHLRWELSLCRSILLVDAVWILLAFFLVIDIQIGHSLYSSMAIFDYSLKVGVADAIARTGIPPGNPSIFPGHLVPIYYHYYWTLLCTVVSTICGSPNNTRCAVLAGLIWTGLAFITCLTFSCRYFKSSKVPNSQMTFFCLALIAVSNLYALISAPLNILRLGSYKVPCVPAMNWWTTDQNSPWLASMYWAPEHMAALVAGIVGSIFLLEIAQADTRRKRLLLIILASCSLASTLGLSAVVGVAFSITWMAWLVLSWCQKRLAEAATTVGVLLISLLISAPYLPVIVGMFGTTGELIFSVRKFEPVTRFFAYFLSGAHLLLHQIAYLLVLPVNYFVGFGFVLVGAFLFWRHRQVAGAARQPARNEMFLILLVCVSLLLGSFVSAKNCNNDFAWRVLLLAQFALTLWSAQFLALKHQEQRRLSPWNWFLIATGVATSLYAVFVDRTSTPYYISGPLLYDQRIIGDELDRKLPPDAILQYNPKMDFCRVDRIVNLYSHRQVVLTPLDPTAISDLPNSYQYWQTTDPLNRLFMNLPVREAVRICRRLRITALLVRDSDKLFYNRSAWVTKFPVIAANEHVRVFRIENGDNLDTLR